MSSVDVIVPCYRYGHFLRECVESVLTQSLQDVRVLIIDDASPDNTAEVAADLVAGDTRVSFERHITNKGHIATYNEGIEWASADYMLILSADDYLLPDALKRAADLMDACPELGFTFGNAVEVEESGRCRFTDSVPGDDRDRILSGLDFIKKSGVRNIVPTPTAIVRTELQKRVGGYSSELPHAGDMEMWLRLAAHASVGFVPTNQAVCRKHSNNMSLEYMAKGQLPDLEQRKSALDCFLRTCGHLLPNSQQLRCSFFSSLARVAIGLASTAFNGREMVTSRNLSAFALETYPQIRTSLPWVKLAFKRRLGSKVWDALRPGVDRIRQIKLNESDRRCT